MRDNATTDTVSPPLDCEDWRIAFGSYVKHPYLALSLAQHLSALQGYVQSDTGRATAAINRAVDALYEHSEFRAVSLELFRATVHGRLSVEVESLVHQLGRDALWSFTHGLTSLSPKLRAIRRHLGISQTGNAATAQSHVLLHTD